MAQAKVRDCRSPDCNAHGKPAVGNLHAAKLRTSRESALSTAAPQPGLADAALIARVRSGERDAIAELYDRYSPLVYSVALRVLGDTSDAEDVLQDVFMQLWRHPATFDTRRGTLAPWLAVIARHRAIDILRRRRPQSDVEDVVVAIDAELETSADRARAAEKVRGCLHNMPENQRKMLEMAFFEGMTHSEIATRTGEPLGTVKTRIRAALIALRKSFKQ